VENIERKISKADQTIRHYVEKSANDPVAKQRALQAMKRKKMLEQQRSDLIGAQFNVDSLSDQQEQAKFTLRAVDAMRVGRDRLKADQAKMDVRKVEEMLDQTEEMADDMRMISESLARGSDQASLECELLQLQKEYGHLASAVPPAGAKALAPPALAASPSRKQLGAQPAAASEEWGRAAAEAPLPPPPPPPAQTKASQNKVSADISRQADLWAASALSAAMAPHGHLPYPGLQQPARVPSGGSPYPQRVAVAANFY